MKQPADLLVDGMRGVLDHDIGIQTQLTFGNGLRGERQRMRGRDGKYPADRAYLGVIDASAIQQRIRRANGDVGLIINDGIPDAVIHLGRHRDLAGRKLFFQHLEQTRGMAWRIQKLINADAHPRLNALRNGINPALDGMKVIQQVGRFTIKIKTGFGQLNAARVAYKQHHVQPGLHTFDGVTDGGSGHAQLGRRFA